MLLLAAVPFDDISTLILAIAALIAQVAVLYAIHKKVADTAFKVEQIDNAVNGRPVGSETVGEQVATATAVLPLVAKMAPQVDEMAEDIKHIKATKGP